MISNRPASSIVTGFIAVPGNSGTYCDSLDFWPVEPLLKNGAETEPSFNIGMALMYRLEQPIPTELS